MTECKATHLVQFLTASTHLIQFCFLTMILDTTLGPQFHLKIGFKQPRLRKIISATYRAIENVQFGQIMVILWFCMACKMENDDTFSSKFNVKNFWIDTHVYCKFKIYNFKDYLRNLNNTVQYRSASTTALHIENEETDSIYFGHLHGMLVCVAWLFKFARCCFPNYCLKNHQRESIHHQQTADSSYLNYTDLPAI